MDFKRSVLYSSYVYNDKLKLYFNLSEDNPAESIKEKMLERYIENYFNKSLPEEHQIVDEIELLNLDKSFDVNSFLKKYENLL